MMIAFAVLVLVIGRIVLLWVSPQRADRWCKGTGTWHGMRCWRCKGDGHTWRWGARLLRKAHLASVQVYRDWREEGER